MSSLFQGFTDTTGVVKTLVSSAAPVGSTVYRGILFDSAGAVVIKADVGFARTFVGGFAVEPGTGILLVAGTVTPNIQENAGVLTDQNGSVQVAAGPTFDVVHQGVALLANGTVVMSNIPP